MPIHHIAWQTTYKCNLSCIHCYAAGVSSGGLLSTFEAKKIILEALEIGAKAFVFTGGEPLLREDIVELITYASDVGLKPILATNGTLLSEDMLKLLRDVEASITINLPTINEELHEKFTGVKSALKSKLNIINKCIEYKLKCSIGIAITNLNIMDVDNVIQYVKDKEINIDIIATIPCGNASINIIPKGFKYYFLLKHLYNKWKASPMNMFNSEFLARNISIYEPIYIALLAGDYCKDLSRLCSIGETIHIMEDGSIRTCVFLPYIVGNVRRLSLANVWRRLASNRFVSKLKDPKRLKGYCNTCKLNTVCGGCRARAYHIVNDFFASDPICILHKVDKKAYGFNRGMNCR
jgi:radical SAM protein with 4Fe4S-binding SPASM domain